MMKKVEDVGLHGSWRGYQRAYPVRIQIPASVLESGTAYLPLQSRANARAATMATTKFLNDRHKTDVDTSDNLINNAEDVENTAFQV